MIISSFSPETKCNIPMPINSKDWNPAAGSKLPKTSCNIPMQGTKEFQEWKNQQQDSFNGKAVEKEPSSFLDKVKNFLKK